MMGLNNPTSSLGNPSIKAKYTIAIINTSMMRSLGKIILAKHEFWSCTESYLVFLGYSWDSFGASTIRSSRKSFRNRSRGMAGIGLGPVDLPRDHSLKLKMLLEFKLSIVVMYPEFFCHLKVHAHIYTIWKYDAIDGSSFVVVYMYCLSHFLTRPSKHPAHPSGVAYCKLSSGTGAWSARLDSLTWHAVTEDDQRALKLYIL